MEDHKATQKLQRADKVLVDKGFCTSRSKAADLIKKGLVYWRGEQIRKPSQLIGADSIELKEHDQYVSRGAEKLKGAIDQFNIDCRGKIVADVGASTGGFTDYVLKNGAVEVFAIDVGHDQLAESLIEDARVHNLEGVNIRDGANLPYKVDLCVVDLSFISLKLVFEQIWSLLKEEGEAIILMKPQFEVGKENIGKNGLVKDDQLREKLKEDFSQFFSNKGADVLGVMLSPIEGRSGNKEYLYYLKK